MQSLARLLRTHPRTLNGSGWRWHCLRQLRTKSFQLAGQLQLPAPEQSQGGTTDDAGQTTLRSQATHYRANHYP